MEGWCTVKLTLPSAGDYLTPASPVGDVCADNYKPKEWPYKKVMTTKVSDAEWSTGYFAGGARFPVANDDAEAPSDELSKCPQIAPFVRGMVNSVTESISFESEIHLYVRERADALKGRQEVN